MISPTLGASSWAAVGPGLRVVRVVERLRTTWAAMEIVLVYSRATVGPGLCVVRVVERLRASSWAAVDLDQLLEALPALAELVPPSLVQLMQLLQVMRPFPIRNSTSND